MKRYFVMAALAFSAMSVVAQETYENAKLMNEDLNGTARYVGMGGAMEALGADISTIGSNPAGLGLFRRSTINGSLGLVMQQGGKDFADANKTNVSFDQLGFVYAMKSGRDSYLNFGFNYHKSKNFDYILSAAGNLNNASQNKLTFNKAYVSAQSGTSLPFNVLDDLYMNHMLKDENGDLIDGGYPATGFLFDRGHSGYIGEYDFNVSGNIHDRVYLGLTFGIHDVNYKGQSDYTERLETGDNITIADDREIDGTGFDVKAGIIVRPIEESPFRIGAYVHTPIWYDLTTSNNTRFYQENTFLAGVSKSYDFKLYTPWKFGLSVGHTIGNYLALGATYEYADYGTADTRIIDGDYYYDYYWGYDYAESSSSDRPMNDHTKKTLKGVSTLKLGLEYKPDPSLAIRCGYNYVSPMYKRDGFKDVSIPSYGSEVSSASDFTNWKSTNRITLGLGYTVKKFSLDLAYQYSVTDGDFTPFTNYEAKAGEPVSHDNITDGFKVDNKRHQLLLTLGYKF